MKFGKEIIFIKKNEKVEVDEVATKTKAKAPGKKRA